MTWLRSLIALVVSLLLAAGAFSDEIVVTHTLSLPSDSVMEVGRDPILGHLSIVVDGTTITLSHEDRTNLYLQDAFVFDGQPYILAYDVVKNIPSGRRLAGQAEENTLHAVTVDKETNTGTLSQVAAMPAGIDISALSVEFNNRRLECGQNVCLHISKNVFGILRIEQFVIPAGLDLVELATDGNVAYGLFQATFNDQTGEMPAAEISIFSLCRIDLTVEGCVSIAPDVIPYRLVVVDRKTYYSTLTDAASASDLFAYDLDRLRGGLANYAENNLEARLVWSNIYLLNGLVSAVSGDTGYWVDPKLASELTSRLESELAAIVRVGQTIYPGFQVKRYTLDREPVTFLLHLGRIARIFARTQDLLPELSAEGLAVIRSQIEDPTQTVEELSPGAVKYRKYQPFWADGSNVPWNYQSGWIEGAILAGFAEKNRQYIISLLIDFVKEEQLLDGPDKWNYASGVFDSGWVDGISANTPTYSGNHLVGLPAHISYRSMDAMAVLAAEKAGMVGFPGLSKHFADLVSRGLLFPFVSEALDHSPDIPFNVARHYARAYLPWQVQNQPWALGALVSSADQF